MPVFYIKDGRHFVSIITGPSHVLLGIRFTAEAAEPALVRLPAQGPCDHGELDEGEIRAAVDKALANLRDGGAEIHAAEIAYVENDTPNYGLFLYAAHRVAKQYLEGGEFKPASW